MFRGCVFFWEVLRLSIALFVVVSIVDLFSVSVCNSGSVHVIRVTGCSSGEC